MNKNLLFTFLFFFGCFYLQSQTITGKIINASTFEPIQNVALITDANKGSISDKSGHFSLEIKNLKTITFSSMGFETLTLKIKDLKRLNYIVSLIEKVNELEEIQLNLANISLDSILIKSQKSMQENYISGAITHQFYSKEKTNINFRKLKLELEKSTLLSRKKRKEAEKEFTNYAEELKNSNPDFSSEFYGSISSKKVYSKKIKKHYNLDKIDTVSGYKTLNKGTKVVNLKEAQEDLQNIILKHLDKDKTYRVSSGLFKIEDSLSLKKIIKKSDSIKEDITFNEYKPMSNFIDSKVKATFFNFDKELNFFNQKYYNHTLENNEILGVKMLYVVGFTPRKSKAKFTGRIFINPTDFTIVKVEYEYAKGKRGQNLNLKWMLGIKFSENLNKKTLFYEKNKDDKVYMSYYKKTTGTYAYVHRPIKFKENSSTKNKVKFDIKIELDTKQTAEVLVFNVSNIEATQVKPMTKKTLNKKISYISVDNYNKSTWRNRQLIINYLKKYE